LANLSECNFGEAIFVETGLSDVDLSRCKDLELIRHEGPSPIDIRTLQHSGPLPLVFLRGVGLPDNLIDYLPSLLKHAIQRYSCFISYSTKDQLFADRLYADLQNQGVRCWFAPHDLPIGAKTWDAIDEAIRLRDKLLLILSEASIASNWVEDEVSKAHAEERDRKTTMLFPIRIDDVVMATVEPWARKLRDQRNIGNFCNWKDVAESSEDRLLPIPAPVGLIGYMPPDSRRVAKELKPKHDKARLRGAGLTSGRSRGNDRFVTTSIIP
jgi:hypothetical protein